MSWLHAGQWGIRRLVKTGSSDSLATPLTDVQSENQPVPETSAPSFARLPVPDAAASTPVIVPGITTGTQPQPFIFTVADSPINNLSELDNNQPIAVEFKNGTFDVPAHIVRRVPGGKAYFEKPEVKETLKQTTFKKWMKVMGEEIADKGMPTKQEIFSQHLLTQQAAQSPLVGAVSQFLRQHRPL